MAVKALTPTQAAAVALLVQQNRIEAVPADEQRAQNFLNQCDEALEDVGNVSHTNTEYNLAYDAAHDVGEAMLAAYGYRTTHGPGQHDALGRFLAAVFDAPPANAGARHFDRMRRDRNQQRYNARPATSAAATAASRAARTLVAEAKTRMS